MGRVALSITFKRIETPIIALVTPSMKNEFLLSMRDLKNMHILPKAFPDIVVNKITSEDQLRLMKEAIVKDYEKILQDRLSVEPMAGEPMTIHLEEGAVPHQCLTARSIPLHWERPAGEAVQKLMDSRVLIQEHGPTDWIAPGFFVPKGDPIAKEALKKGMVVVTLKDLRLVVDYTNLNKHVKRPVHPFPPTKAIIEQLPSDGCFFATLDAVHGYHQIPLTEESSKLTTFVLPTGKYRFLRAPMGLSASSDEWCRRSDQVIEGLEGVQKIVDDILVSAPTIETLNDRIRQVLDRCIEKNVVISLKKFQVSHRVKFAGHIISSEGVAPDPERLKAIRDFRAPSSIREVRAFLGLVNQLASFHPDLSTHDCQYA